MRTWKTELVGASGRGVAANASTDNGVDAVVDTICVPVQARRLGGLLGSLLDDFWVFLLAVVYRLEWSHGVIQRQDQDSNSPYH